MHGLYGQSDTHGRLTGPSGILKKYHSNKHFHNGKMEGQGSWLFFGTQTLKWRTFETLRDTFHGGGVGFFHARYLCRASTQNKIEQGSSGSIYIKRFQVIPPWSKMLTINSRLHCRGPLNLGSRGHRDAENWHLLISNSSYTAGGNFMTALTKFTPWFSWHSDQCTFIN